MPLRLQVAVKVPQALQSMSLFAGHPAPIQTITSIHITFPKAFLSRHISAQTVGRFRGPVVEF